MRRSPFCPRHVLPPPLLVVVILWCVGIVVAKQTLNENSTMLALLIWINSCNLTHDEK